MTTYNTVIKKRNATNNGWDSVLPITTAENILINAEGDTLATHLADKAQHIGYATASGTNTYTASITGITSLSEGLSIKIKFTNVNTGASTLNINGLGAKAIQKGNGNALSSGNIKAGQICHLVYTGSVFQLLGEGGEYGTAGAAQVLQGYTFGSDDGLKNGTMPVIYETYANNILAAETLLRVIPSVGYYSGTSHSLVADYSFISANIVSGKSIFGLAGIAEEKLNLGLALKNFPIPESTYRLVDHINGEGMWGWVYPSYDVVLYNDAGILVKTLTQATVKTVRRVTKEFILSANGGDLYVYNHNGVYVKTISGANKTIIAFNSKINYVYGVTGLTLTVFNYTSGATVATYTINESGVSVIMIIPVYGGVLVFYPKTGYAGIYADFVSDAGVVIKEEYSYISNLLMNSLGY